MTEYETNVWYGWNGGACPVHPETVVEVQFDTDRDVEKAKFWEWQHQHEGEGSDIIAFRVINEHREPREFWAIQIEWDEIGAEPEMQWIESESSTKGAVLFREVLE